MSKGAGSMGANGISGEGSRIDLGWPPPAGLCGREKIWQLKIQIVP